MSRKLLIIPLIIAFSGLLLAQTIEVTVTSTEEAVSLNHSESNITDWIDCRWNGSALELNRKAGVTEQIVLETVGVTLSEVSYVEDRPLVRSWTDGTPTAEATNIDDSWFLQGIGNGFKFTVPAGTNNRRLYLYLANYWSTCVLTATTSDGANYTSEAFYSEGGADDKGIGRYFMIDFQATSDNETLVVTWILTEATGVQYGDVVAVTAAQLIVSPALDVDETSTVIPERFNLSQNFPNPFNPTTMIHYDIPKATQVTIAIYDLTGRAVKTLVNEFKDVGNHSVTWDARDDEGNRMSGGVYLYSIQAGNYQKTQKMVLLK